jgi:hypothetical protein
MDIRGGVLGGLAGSSFCGIQSYLMLCRTGHETVYGSKVIAIPLHRGGKELRRAERGNRPT